MTRSVAFLALVASAASCGSDNNPAIDAAKTADAKVFKDAKVFLDAKPADAKVFLDAAAPSGFTSVTCPATPDATVVTSGMAYSPVNTPIKAGQVVRFTMPSIHDVSGTGAATGLNIDFGGDGCYKFTVAATYSFTCLAHGFNGSIVVSP